MFVKCNPNYLEKLKKKLNRLWEKHFRQVILICDLEVLNIFRRVFRRE